MPLTGFHVLQYKQGISSFSVAMTITPNPSMQISARLRRTRGSEGVRRLVREATLTPADLVLPIFVSEVDEEIVEIGSMPGVYRWPIKRIPEIVESAEAVGIGAILLFGIPEEKNPEGQQASAKDGIIQQAIRTIRNNGFKGVVITDVCLWEYTDHGHCGLLDEDGTILNDASLSRLAEPAVSHAEAGADIVAPSAMMDGQVASIRTALDATVFILLIHLTICYCLVDRLEMSQAI